MKLLIRLLPLCLVVIGLARGEGAAQEKNDVSTAKLELVWPEIKNPQALIEYARNQIKSFNRDHPGVVQNLFSSLSSEFNYLKPRQSLVSYDRFGIILDTHPYTGQALLITPDPVEYWARHKDQVAGVVDTQYPEIKFMLANIAPMESGLFEYLKGLSVNWTDFRNLESGSKSWPQPLKMRLPDYPNALVKIGVEGSATIELTVTERGETTDWNMKCVPDEIEPLILEALRDWKFEPGVDLKNRLPARTRISLTVVFRLKQE